MSEFWNPDDGLDMGEVNLNSVRVKGMKMPKSCFGCVFYSGNECYLYSYGIPARYNYNPDTKPEWCELEEI